MLSENYVVENLRKRKLFTPLVAKAFDQAKRSHKGQFRLNGNPYFEDHILQVVFVLAKCREEAISEQIIAAAALHDCLEDDCEMSEQLFLSMFPKRMFLIVKALTKDYVENNDSLTEDEIAEINKKMIEKIRKQSREVQLIKLADRYSNVLNIDEIQYSHPQKHQRFIRETRELFLPFAFSTSPFFYRKLKKIVDNTLL